MRILELTEQEFQALAGLLDAGVRAVGLRAVKEAASILTKMESAQTDGPALSGVEEPITSREE